MAKYKSLTHKELPIFMWMNEKLLYYAAAKKKNGGNEDKCLLIKSWLGGNS